jgi:hypothetical protein
MNEKDRSRVVAEGEIKTALACYRQASENRKKVKELMANITQNLETVRSCLGIVKSLRWGKGLVETTIGEYDALLPDLLRAWEGDFRE